MHRPSLFQTFFLGGFECSTHRRADGRRLDLLASTGHDRWAARDYAALQQHGIAAARDGLRWHLIERTPGRYDWSSFLPMLRTAHEQGTQVIWDLCHYGWPDDIDVWRPEFVERFARFAAAAAKLMREETDSTAFYSPINEISYWSWAGGDHGQFNPMGVGRGAELKVQLVRASIAAIDAIRAVDPGARFVQVDPAIHIRASSDRPGPQREAEVARQAQFEAWDMLCGKAWPGLGGKPDYLDIVGINYYSNNQWYLGGAPSSRAIRTTGRSRASSPRSTSATGGRCWSPRPARRRPARPLAALRRRAGRPGAAARRAGGGHLPVPDPRLPGLGRRTPLPHRPVRLRRRQRRAGAP